MVISHCLNYSVKKEKRPPQKMQTSTLVQSATKKKMSSTLLLINAFVIKLKLKRDKVISLDMHVCAKQQSVNEI